MADDPKEELPGSAGQLIEAEAGHVLEPAVGLIDLFLDLGCAFSLFCGRRLLEDAIVLFSAEEPGTAL